MAVASLRPGDPTAQRLQSTATATDNVLVKVTLPKRTGRKRKRGSDEPFQSNLPVDGPNDSITATELLEGLRDRPDNYTMEAMGFIEDTHRFRGLPDFQFRAGDDPVMHEIKQHAMSPNYETLKRFSISRRMEAGGSSSFPGPPSFVPTGRSYQYEYRQTLGGERPLSKKKGPAGMSMLDTGIALDSESVPQGPPAGDRTAGKAGQKMVDALNSLLAKRPIVTLRAATSLLDCHYTKISFAVQYVGYYVKQGPWEGAIVKYGVDPRTDPKYRIYQTIHLNFHDHKNINAELKTREHTSPAHTFDGSALSDVGKSWQVCDLTDSLLQALVNTDDIREQCDSMRFGWYKNGTVAKIRVIAREKMLSVIHRDKLIAVGGFTTLSELPNRIDNEFQCDLGKGANLYLQRVAKQIAKDAIHGPFKSDRNRRVNRKAWRVGVQDAQASPEAVASDEEHDGDEEQHSPDMGQSNGDSGEEESDADDTGTNSVMLDE